MKVSVIVCTYNRCESLPIALESVASQSLPDGAEWEVLVVDNNSKDETRRVIEGFCERYPGRFRYLFELRQGLSNARNAGIREARGEIIAFTDDDVILAPDWLRELILPFQSNEYTAVGGRVHLPKDFSPPRWMALEGLHSLGGMLAFFDLGSEAGPLTKPPIGANMAFRREVFEKYGGFRADLGRTGDSLIGNEDTEFGNRLFSAGQRLWYQPSAIVYHPVPKERLTKKYFRAWWFAFGRAAVRARGKRSSVGIIPRPLISLANRVLKLLPRRVWWWLRETNPQKKFFDQCQVWMMLGEIAEICRRLFEPETQDSGLQSQIAKQ